MNPLLLVHQSSCCSWNEGYRWRGEGKMVAMQLEGCLIQVGRKMSEINGKLLAMEPENISSVSGW